MCIISEFVERGTLHSALRDLSFPWSLKLKLCLLAQAAKGIAFLHSQCVVHRNLKSQNMLLTRDMVLKVTDVSISFLIKFYFKGFDFCFLFFSLVWLECILLSHSKLCVEHWHGWPQKSSLVLIILLSLAFNFLLTLFTGGGYDSKADVFSFAMIIFEVLTHSEPNTGFSLFLIFVFCFLVLIFNFIFQVPHHKILFKCLKTGLLLFTLIFSKKKILM